MNEFIEEFETKSDEFSSDFEKIEINLRYEEKKYVEKKQSLEIELAETIEKLEQKKLNTIGFLENQKKFQSFMKQKHNPLEKIQFYLDLPDYVKTLSENEGLVVLNSYSDLHDKNSFKRKLYDYERGYEIKVLKGLKLKTIEVYQPDEKNGKIEIYNHAKQSIFSEDLKPSKLEDQTKWKEVDVNLNFEKSSIFYVMLSNTNFVYYRNIDSNPQPGRSIDGYMIIYGRGNISEDNSHNIPMKFTVET